jgi:pentatricopeptide repeat protein
MKLSLPVGLWLSLLAASNAFSPISAGFQLGASRTQQQSPFTRTCVWSTPRDASTDDDEDAVSKFSKVKWKKKRYLIMQDVKQSIRQGSPHAPRKAQEMVRRMLTLYEKSGFDTDYKPTSRAYNLWINALARSKLENAGDLAEQVLEDMKADGVEPDIVTYTSVMDAHAKSKSPQKAEKVFYQLLDQTADSNGVGVSAVTCDTILNAWAQHGTKEGAERAQSILQKLEVWQQKDIRPTKFSYATGASL